LVQQPKGRQERDTTMRINVKAFALTLGIVWGLGLFALTWWIMAFDGVTREVTMIGQVYRGYNISPLGSVFGLVWGFFDALVGGAITAWLYNLIAARFEHSKP
jgi:hypothetical protein